MASRLPFYGHRLAAMFRKGAAKGGAYQAHQFPSRQCPPWSPLVGSLVRSWGTRKGVAREAAHTHCPVAERGQRGDVAVAGPRGHGGGCFGQPGFEASTLQVTQGLEVAFRDQSFQPSDHRITVGLGAGFGLQVDLEGFEVRGQRGVGVLGSPALGLGEHVALHQLDLPLQFT
ncbi:MAG TPA: hypothetical protein PKY77_01320 [Phycisphaerae bacterium]|nr:hypothetical protein [Phycisphaerae bacterium]HRY67504.1 hypothetical protein [Phycisphaerae bacterium]HSA24891.1 hypothetical protein [Phycisphaerae bacterium]